MRIFQDVTSSNKQYIAYFSSEQIYIARKTSINVYIHLSDYWSGRKLKKIELSRAIKFSVFHTILDKTLETIPANIAKLLNIDKTKFVSPSDVVQDGTIRQKYFLRNTRLVWKYQTCKCI
jgi:hypothetical protein